MPSRKNGWMAPEVTRARRKIMVSRRIIVNLERSTEFWESRNERISR
jgi:hypothetical protein